MFSMCLSRVSRRICSMTFPGTEMRLIPSLLHSSLLTDGYNISLFSNYLELHLTAVTSQISCTVTWQLHQPILSGFCDASHSVDLCTSRFLRWPWTWEAFFSSSPHPSERCGKRDCYWRMRPVTEWMRDSGNKGHRESRVAEHLLCIH